MTFLGVASAGSKVIIDSFRYIPPLYDDDCHVYDGEFVTSSPVKPEAIESEDCIAYNFESDFEALFDNDRGLCTGFTRWQLNKYTTLPIDHPSSESLKFISPQEYISCVSSFPFEASNGGVVEVNIYMEAAELTDQITVLVNKIADEASDMVIGSAGVSPLVSNYADGWHVLKIVLSGSDTFNGYVSSYFYWWSTSGILR